MCSTRSNAFEASKNTACTDEPWVTKYEAVCFNKNEHWSVLCFDTLEFYILMQGVLSATLSRLLSLQLGFEPETELKGEERACYPQLLDMGDIISFVPPILCDKK